MKYGILCISPVKISAQIFQNEMEFFIYHMKICAHIFLHEIRNSTYFTHEDLGTDFPYQIWNFVYFTYEHLAIDVSTQKVEF